MAFIYGIDFFFFIDILVNFNTAILNEEFEVTDDRWLIAKEYLNSWFIVDLLSIIPFDLVVLLFIDDNEQGDTGIKMN